MFLMGGSATARAAPPFISPLGPAPAKLITDGNSLTVGISAGQAIAWPTQLGTTRPGLTIVNVAVSGNTVQNRIDAAATDVDPLFIAGAWVVLLCGINDLFLGASADTTYGRIVTYCQARKAVGFRVGLCTLTPRSDAGTPGTQEADRQTVNGNIRTYAVAQGYADVVIDLALDARIGLPGCQLDATYFNVDPHMNTTGYGVIRDLVHAALPS